MLRRTTSRMLAGLTLAFALAACQQDSPLPVAPDPFTLEAAGPDSSVPVLLFSDLSQAGTARVIRTPNGVNFQLHTSGLTPGNAYTLWFVVFNDTDGCADGTPGVSFCGPADVVNDAADPDMMYAAGHVVGNSGRATFSGNMQAGSAAGSVNGPVGLPSYGLSNPHGAEFHLVVHNHGSTIAEYMPDMIQSIDGGCTDAGVPAAGAPSPWNDHPGFGRRGPNTCASVQFSLHPPS